MLSELHPKNPILPSFLSTWTHKSLSSTFPLFLPFFYTPSYYRLFDVWLFLRLAQINGAFGLREPEKIRESGTQRNVISPPLYIILANTHSHTHCYSPKQVVESKWEQSDALMEAMSRGKGGGGGPERERCKKMKARNMRAQRKETRWYIYM